jgi:tetratricopeptide (TPR) repeat protein
MKRLVAIVIALIAATAIFGADAPVGYDGIIQLGNTELKAGKSDPALQDGQKAIKLNAQRWEGYALAGGALMNLKRYEEAADDFTEALKYARTPKQPSLTDLRRQALLTASSDAPASCARWFRGRGAHAP